MICIFNLSTLKVATFMFFCLPFSQVDVKVFIFDPFHEELTHANHGHSILNNNCSCNVCENGSDVLQGW